MVWGLNLKSLCHSLKQDSAIPVLGSLHSISHLLIHSFNHTTRYYRWLREALATSWSKPLQCGPNWLSSAVVVCELKWLLTLFPNPHIIPVSEPWFITTSPARPCKTKGGSIYSKHSVLLCTVLLATLALLNITPGTVTHSRRQHFTF